MFERDAYMILNSRSFVTFVTATERSICFYSLSQLLCFASKIHLQTATCLTLLGVKTNDRLISFCIKINNFSVPQAE